MEFRQLECFIAVAEELHFGRAAARLCMTQPPLSRQIQLLEQDLGVTLFERSSRQVELSAAGRRFLRDARHLLEYSARAAATAGYVPPQRLQGVPVAGRNGIANFEMVLVNMREGGMISAHDYRVARSAAVALCGGEVETGSKVDEEWLLAVERKEFVALLRTPETQARIRHTLDTGKPLRN